MNNTNFKYHTFNFLDGHYIWTDNKSTFEILDYVLSGSFEDIDNHLTNPVKDRAAMKAILDNAKAAAKKIKCDWCLQYYHSYQFCPLRFECDKLMRKSGFAFEWGGIKGAAYYRGKFENGKIDQEVIEVLSRHGPNKRQKTIPK